jgi:hypothetical protein
MVLVPLPLSAAVIKEAGEFFKQFGGIHEFLESVLDVPKGYVERWHSQNLIRWYDKWQAEKAKRNAEGRKPIPPNLLVPALRQIAMEDDDDILAMWARLFANFQDPDRRLEPNKVYIHLLSEMQPLDAKLLQHIVNPIGVHFVVSSELADEMGVSDGDIVLAVHNLSRLGCLLARPVDLANYIVADGGPSPLPQVPSIITEDGTFYLNSLGRMLVSACSDALDVP